MSQRPDSVSAEAYRAVMRHWPSGVTVVTMPGEEAPHGMTASAFTSVSLNPPLVLIVVDKRWRSHAFLMHSGVFCVNILRATQSEVSDRFAGRQGELSDRFAGLAVGRAVTGAPVLLEALAWLDCAVDQQFDAGDHTIFVGRVVATDAADETGEPLLYHDTRYRLLAQLGP